MVCLTTDAVARVMLTSARYMFTRNLGIFIGPLVGMLATPRYKKYLSSNLNVY